MKGKKALSMVTAGILSVTMAMPVMAAESGEITVPVTTKNAVIRVQVPTTMAIAVDQFMMTDAGTQISSTAFTMANKSAVDVKVAVTSIATLGASTKLVGTKSGAKESTKAGEAWLGVAAQSEANSYDDPTTNTADTEADPAVADTPETIATLTEANANVATFVTGDTATEGKATQTFYLQKGAGDVAYKLLNAGEDADEVTYAQFYELEAKTAANQDALNALIAANNVYIGKSTAADGETLTLVEKGGSHTLDADNETYYTAASDTTAKASLDASKLYVYGETANADTDGNAAFRYIGILSGGQEAWSKDDISTIKIKYDIVGVTADKYTEVADECHYGLHIPEAVEVAGTKIAKGDGTAISGAAAIATRLKGTSGTQFQFDVSEADLSGLEVTKIVIDGQEYEFTAAANTAASASAASDGKVYTIKNFTADTVSKIQMYYGNEYVITWTIS